MLAAIARQTLPQPNREHRKARRRRRTEAGRLERVKQIVVRAQRSGCLSDEARDLVDQLDQVLRS